MIRPYSLHAPHAPPAAPPKRLRSHPSPPTIQPSPTPLPPSPPSTALCPADPTGPRIPTLFQLYTAKAHAGWVAGVANACILAGRLGFVCQACAHRSDLYDTFEERHGAKTVLRYAKFYLTKHVPNRFFGFSDGNWRQLVSALRAFHTWAVTKQYMPEEQQLEVGFLRLAEFPMATLKQRLEDLGRIKYWDELERQVLQRTGRPDASLDDVQFDRRFGGSMHLIVAEVERDGWAFECDPFDCGDCRNTGRVFVQLPEEVATLGVVGMELSCITLGLRNRVWRPIQRKDTGEFFANVYPPRAVFRV